MSAAEIAAVLAAAGCPNPLQTADALTRSGVVVDVDDLLIRGMDDGPWLEARVELGALGWEPLAFWDDNLSMVWVPPGTEPERLRDVQSPRVEFDHGNVIYVAPLLGDDDDMETHWFHSVAELVEWLADPDATARPA